MSELSDRLVRAANDALGNDTSVVLDCSTAEVVATVLRELVNKAFPDDEDVDYEYACEELAMDACDALRDLEITG